MYWIINYLFVIFPIFFVSFLIIKTLLSLKRDFVVLFFNLYIKNYSCFKYNWLIMNKEG